MSILESIRDNNVVFLQELIVSLENASDYEEIEQVSFDIEELSRKLKDKCANIIYTQNTKRTILLEKDNVKLEKLETPRGVCYVVAGTLFESEKEAEKYFRTEY